MDEAFNAMVLPSHNMVYEELDSIFQVPPTDAAQAGAQNQVVIVADVTVVPSQQVQTAAVQNQALPPPIAAAATTATVQLPVERIKSLI